MENEMFKLPLIPIRDPDLVVFPGLLCEIDVGRPFSVEAIKKSKNSGKILIGMQKDSSSNEPNLDALYPYCVEAEIKSILSLTKSEAKFRIIIRGNLRGRLDSIFEEDGCFWGTYKLIPEEEIELTEDIKNKIKEIKNIIDNQAQYIVLENNNVPKNSSELSNFLDVISGQLPIPGSRRIEFLAFLSLEKRLDEVLKTLVDISKNIELEIEFGEENLPDSDALRGMSSEIKKLGQKVEESGMPTDVLKIAKSELKRLSMMSPGTSEFQVSFNYVDNLASLPWDIETEDEIEIDKAKEILDEEHYGLKKPKERILEFLAVRKLKPERKGPILCFAGPPGTGKTSQGKAIASAIGRKFIRMSLGGVGDEAEIRGHRRTYIGALPGRIMENIKKVGTKNPVYMLDEIDKLCSNFRGDPSSALLEVLDPEQNNSFVDHYLGVPFDLSHVLFIATVNETSTIPPALRDRLEIINIPGYSPHDKTEIAKGYLVPKQLEANGLEEYKEKISLSDKAVVKVIEEYTSEAGVRSLERECGTIMRKLAVEVASGNQPPEIIDETMVPDYLGPPKLFTDRAVEEPEVGLSTGLAWSRSGGSILFVETAITPGKGEIKKPTGNLGKIIQESVNAAYTWIKANANRYGISLDTLNNNDIHIHFPAGATPKEGPSAGVAIAASIVSALTNKPVRNDIAMTGEISLRGRVLPIGGLKEKILAAHRAGINNVIFPEKNKYDAEEVPEDVVSEMKFYKVSKLEDALEILLLDEKNSNINDINVNDEEMMNSSL